MNLFKRLPLLCSFIGVITLSSVKTDAQINVTLGTQTALPADWFGYNGANVIRQAMPSYNTEWFMDSVNSLGTSTIRYAAGNVANYFDWQIGFFDRKLPEGWLYPQDFGDNQYKNLDLNTLKPLIDRTGATPIFDMNMLTRDKYYETAELMFASGINLNVKYVEFGNELYHEGRNFVSRFPTPESYITESNQWASYMKSRPGLTGFKIAAVGASLRYPSEPMVSRRNRWSSVVAGAANSSIDAITIHWYIAPKLGTLSVNEQNTPRIVETPFTAFSDLSDDLNIIRSAGKEAWFTEYNLYDRFNCLQQNYVHGLYAAGMTLAMLQDTVIKIVDCHALIGSSLFGSIMNDNTDLDLSEFYDVSLDCTPAPVPATNPHELSAQGNCMLLVGQALKNAQTRRKMTFSNCPKLPLGSDALFGYWLGCKTTDEMIILNLDSVDRTINIGSTVFNLANGKYVQVYPGPGGVLDLIKGNAKLAPGNLECTTTGTLNASQTMLLRKYSVTRIYVKKNLVKVKATDVTICSGTNTAVFAEGGSGYTWNNVSLVTVKADKSVMQFNAPIVTTTTNYTFKVTTSQGYTDSVKITVYPKPTLNITQNATQVCKGGQVNFTATLTGGNSANSKSFIWTPSNYFTKADTAIAVAYITDSVTIRCYASDGLCFAANASLPQIKVVPKANAGTDVSLCIDSLPYTLTALEYNASSNYKWYNGSGVLISSNTTATVSPSFPTDYRLIVTSGSNSCSDTDFVTISPYNCCKSSDYPTILTVVPGTKLKSKFIPDLMAFCASNPGHGTCTNDSLIDFHDEIVFNGDFFVDGIFNFVNCDKIRFAEKAQMKFVGGIDKLSFFKCNLQAASCSNRMWNGFYFYNFNAKLTMDSCNVFDCESIVEGYIDPLLFISNTKFDRFYKGIYLSESDFGQPGWFYGVTFTQSSTLKYPHAGDRSLYAFKLDNYTKMTIGDSLKAQNNFANLQYGIISLNSDLYLYNSKFENINTWNTSDSLNGTAVLLQNTYGYGDPNNPTHLYPEIRFFASAQDITNPNKFRNCTNGIYAINARVDIRSNTFNGTKKAITLIGTTAKKTQIFSNTITGADIGIDLIQPKACEVHIANNMVTTNNQTSGSIATPAIRIFDAPGQQCTLAEFTGNTINSGGTHGFWYSNPLFSTIIADNKVYLTNPNATFTSYGMRIENADSLTFKCNLVKGSSASSIANKTAFSFSFCTQTALSCNTADYAATGFEFLGNCNNSLLKNNGMKYLNDGLVVGAVGQTGGVIGPQPTSGFGVPNRNLFLGQYIDNNAGPGFKKGHFGHAATWAINSNCTGAKGTIFQFFSQYNDSLTQPYPNLATGSNAGAFTPFVQKKLGKECIVSCVQPNPNKIIMPLEEDADEQYNPSADLQKDYNFTVKNVLPVLENDATAWSLKCGIYSALNSDADAMKDNVDLQDFYNTNSNSNIAAFVELNNAIRDLNYSSQNKKIMESKIELVQKLNEAIIPSNIIEKSAKAFNTIYFKSMKGFDKLTIDDIKALKKLAYQCPYIAGTSVFQARSLYAIYNSTANYDDALLCSGKYLLTDNDQNKLNFEKTNVEIFPNPSNGKFNIRYDLTHFAKAQISFYDLVGNKVMSMILNVNNDRTVIDFENLSEGIYSYAITADGKQVNRGKVTIIK